MCSGRMAGEVELDVAGSADERLFVMERRRRHRHSLEGIFGRIPGPDSRAKGPY